MKKIFFAAVLACNLMGPAAVQADVLVSKTRLEGTFVNEANTAIGQAHITVTPHGLLFRIDLTGLPPGWHALHVHAKGDCSDHHDHFKKSGGHAALPGQAHGYYAAEGPHSGDLPNIWIHTDGSARLQIYSTNITVDTLRDADGAALMIHAGADDYATQPTGGAGARLACAVIK